MSAGANWTPPPTPQTVALRPLSGGMVTESSSVLAEPGTMRLANGVEVTPKGLKRLGGWSSLVRPAGTSLPVPLMFGNSQTKAPRRLGETVEDFFQLALETGEVRAVVVTNRMLYTVDPTTGYTPAYWKKAYTIVSAGADTAVFSGNLDTDMIVVGDWMEWDSELYQISDVTYASGPGQTTITVNENWATTPSGEVNFLKPFKTAPEDIVDWVVGRNKAYLVDGTSLCAFEFDGTWISGLIVKDSADHSTPIMYGAKTIAVFKDRLYFGNIFDGAAGANSSKHRVRWSEVLTWGESAAANYQDLVAKPGVVVRLKASSEHLLCFTTDDVYYSQETTLDSLPYAFFELQTGGATLVGPRAVASYLNGIIFAGLDDIYLFQAPQDSGPDIQRIGSAVASAMMKSTFNLKRVSVVSDVANSRIAVGVPESGTQFTKIWYFNYKTKAWSYETDVSLKTLSVTSFTDQLRIQDVDPTWTIATNPYAALTIGSLIVSNSPLTLFAFDSNSHLMVYVPDATGHLINIGGTDTVVPIYAQVETQDFDFGEPDLDKSFFSFGLRTEDPTARTVIVKFCVEASTDFGKTWRSLGQIVLSPTDDEDRVTFRMTGSTIRFRLTHGSASCGTTSACQPWTMLEITLKARVRGGEQQRNTDRG